MSARTKVSQSTEDPMVLIFQHLTGTSIETAAAHFKTINLTPDLSIALVAAAMMPRKLIVANRLDKVLIAAGFKKQGGEYNHTAAKITGNMLLESNTTILTAAMKKKVGGLSYLSANPAKLSGQAKIIAMENAKVHTVDLINAHRKDFAVLNFPKWIEEKGSKVAGFSQLRSAAVLSETPVADDDADSAADSETEIEFVDESAEEPGASIAKVDEADNLTAVGKEDVALTKPAPKKVTRAGSSPVATSSKKLKTTTVTETGAKTARNPFMYAAIVDKDEDFLTFSFKKKTDYTLVTKAIGIDLTNRPTGNLVLDIDKSAFCPIFIKKNSDVKKNRVIAMYNTLFYTCIANEDKEKMLTALANKDISGFVESGFESKVDIALTYNMIKNINTPADKEDMEVEAE